MKKLACSFLLLLVSFSTLCQNKKLDSLYVLLSNHLQEDTLRVQLLNNICHYEYTSDNEKNKLHANEAFEISKKINYIPGMGTALKYRSLYYWVIGDYEQATRHALEMLRVFEGTSNDLGLSQAYNLLGLIHERSRDFEKAKGYYMKALEIREKAGLKRDVAYSYNSLGSLHFSLSKYDEALEYFLKSLAIRKELGDEDILSQTYGNLAVVYMKKKDYSTSLDYYQKALNIVEKSANKYRKVVNYTNLSEVYIYLGKYNEAERYLTKSADMAKAMRHKEVLAEIYDKFTLLETTRARFKQAFTYLELKHKYEDSIYTEQQAKQIAEAEARYETVKKDQTIVSLEQQKEFQNLKQLYLVIGLLIISVTFFTIYMLQRSHNQKVNALLDNEKILNLRLQEGDQLKSKFYANISHEFRTPLTLILSPIEERLASSSLTTAERESFHLVARNANRLLSLVNQLLDLSKLEAKKMELLVQKGDLKRLLALVTASFDSLAENKNIHFEKRISIENIETWYDGDKLEKIINNLLFNAFKFTAGGGNVFFSANHLQPTNDLEIIIEDTGIGIPEEEHQNIFSPFYQSRYAADDGQFGTGLGLSLVKELVNLHGGHIELTSKVNKGTTIKITLPVTKERIPSLAIFKNLETNEQEIIRAQKGIVTKLLPGNDIGDEADEQNGHEDTILIVEDNEDLRNFIASTLKDQFKTLTARDGEEGLIIAAEQIPDLIISDVMMPRLDGISLTDKIKTDERTCHIPVVLLTAKADIRSKIEGLQTGADDYLSKPFSTEELRVRVTNLIEQRKKLAAIYSASYSAPATTDPKEPSLDDKFLSKARKIVDDNISDTGFGVEKMADEIHLSRTQLFRKLKAISGMSPNEFINEIRLQKAAALILSKADTLTQISYSVGFNEQSYFAKRFRKKFGVNPSEYSQKNTPQKA